MNSLKQYFKYFVVQSRFKKAKDNFTEWTNKSKNIPFKSPSENKGVGNGEHKLAKELDIQNKLGGQNNIYDLKHPSVGNISVKDMTNDNSCTLGTECCSYMRKVKRQIIDPFICWCQKYKSKCKLAKKYFQKLNKNYGASQITIIDGIDRLELSKTNLSELNSIFNEFIDELQKNTTKKYDSVKSEYIDDMVYNLNNKSLQDILNDCVRKEATNMTLIIVHEKKGWLIVKDINKIYCPRITRGSLRIQYEFS